MLLMSALLHAMKTQLKATEAGNTPGRSKPPTLSVSLWHKRAGDIIVIIMNAPIILYQNPNQESEAVCLTCAAQVTDLDLVIGRVEQQVAGLQVSVGDLETVEVLRGQNDIREESDHLPHLEPPCYLE